MTFFTSLAIFISLFAFRIMYLESFGKGHKLCFPCLPTKLGTMLRERESLSGPFYMDHTAKVPTSLHSVANAKPLKKYIQHSIFKMDIFLVSVKCAGCTSHIFFCDMTNKESIDFCQLKLKQKI